MLRPYLLFYTYYIFTFKIFYSVYVKPLEDSTNQVEHTYKTHGSAEVEQLRQNVLKLKQHLKALTEEHFRATERVNNFDKNYAEAR